MLYVTLPRDNSFTYQNESWKEEEEYFDEYLFMGYEPISNRFKVISILTNNSEQQFWIFTVGDGVKKESWRKIEDLPYLPSVFLKPRPFGETCINGVLYYNVQGKYDDDDDDDDGILRVVSFDLKTEKFNIIQVPLDSTYLVDFQGKLASLTRLGDTSIDIWVLENAEKHEWSRKSFKLPLTCLNLELHKLELVGICERKIVFRQHEDDQTFTFHIDLDKKTIRKVQIPWKWKGFDGLWRYFLANHIDNVVLL